IKADFKGEYFFCTSFRAKPLHPNCSPKGPLTKLSKNAISNTPKLVDDNATPEVSDVVDSSNITTTVIITWIMTTVPRTENQSIGENCIFMKSFSLKPRYILLNSITIAKSYDHDEVVCKNYTIAFGGSMNIAKPVTIRNTINIT